MSRIWKAVHCLILVGLLMGIAGYNSAARAAGDTQSAVMSTIHADSMPYHIEWNGTTGTLSRDAFGGAAASSAPLVFLHSDPGPKGYAKHLAWFLARDGEEFSLLWCYLNDTGDEFYCWFYRYPVNQLTSLQFKGKYSFVAPNEPVPTTLATNFTPTQTPHYAGPDFVYGNWTRRNGTLAKLELRPTHASTFAAPMVDRKPSDAGSPDPGVVKTIEKLRAVPLQEIHVPGGNGWREGGWRELHALAYDAVNDPYYLILYSYSTRGYAIDLKRAQTYVTDFGQKVLFSDAPSVFGASGDLVTGPPELHVARYSRQEFTFTASGTYTNPYNEVALYVQIQMPGGKSIRVPGFWDGGDTWRVRLTPTVTGTWTWRTISTDNGLNGQQGTFICSSEHEESKGFLSVNSAYSYRHDFAMTDGSPFLPVFASYPVEYLPELASQPTASTINYQRYADKADLNRIAAAGNAPQAALKLQTADDLAKLVNAPKPAEPGAVVAENPAVGDNNLYPEFQRTVDGLAALGVNRLIGGYLIDSAQFSHKTQRNEGGAPFVNYDPDRLNPAYFQAMDRRLAYANEKGIVPDIGVGLLDADLFALLSDTQLQRLWTYVLARYSGYNVCWTLLGKPIGKPEPPGGQDLINELVQLTLRYDTVKHPLTSVLPGGVPVTAKPVMPTPGPSGTAIGQSDTGNGRRQGRAQQLPPGNFIESPAGLPLGPAASTPAAPTAPPVALDPIPSWMDVITFNGGPIEEVGTAYSLEKPVVLYDRSDPSSLDEVRHRLWRTRMSGGYWVGDFTSVATSVLDRADVRWEAYSARLFTKTRYWRLVPHNDMLDGSEETPFERRRRRETEAASRAATSAQQADTSNLDDLFAEAFGDAPSVPTPSPEAKVAPKPVAPIYVLADPAWEYLIYFEKGGTMTIDLLSATGRIALTWFNPRTGEFTAPDSVMGGTYHSFHAPDNNDWVLYLSRR